MNLQERERLFKLGYYNLDRNENLDDVLRTELRLICQKMEFPISNYPDYPQFIDQLSSFLDISSTNFMVTCGCTEAIKITMDAFIRSGTKALVLKPTYSSAVDYLKSLDADIFSVPPPETIDELYDIINYTGTEFVYLCNPNNPTGTKYDSLEKLALTKARIFVDESYYEFGGTSALKLATQASNIIVGRSFSKAWGLAGLRMGLLISNQRFIFELTPFKLKAGVNVIGVGVLSELLNNYKLISDSVKRVKAGGDYMRFEITKRGWRIFNEPNVNFIWSDIPSKDLNELKVLHKVIEGRTCFSILPKPQAEAIFKFQQ